MIILSESLLRDGVPQRDPLAIPRDLVHNSSMHFTFNKFWKRYGKFAKHLMKVGSNTILCCLVMIRKYYVTIQITVLIAVFFCMVHV